MTGIYYKAKKGAELLMVIVLIAIGKTAIAQCTSFIGYNTNATDCGEFVAFFLNATPPTDSVVYDFGDGTTFSTNGISAQNEYNAGTYLVQTTAYHTNGCISVDSVELDIDGFQVSMPADTVVCQPTEQLILHGVLSGGGTPGAYSYQWSPATGLSGQYVAAPVVVENVTDQDYTLTVTENLSGCTASATINVTLNSPVIETLDLCDGPVMIDLGPGAIEYNWLSFTDTAGNNTPLTIANTVQAITVDDPGEYFAYAVFPECGALTSLITVEVCEEVCTNTFTYNIGNGVCAFDEFEFFSAGTPNIVQWHWDFGDGTTSTDPNPTHVFPADSYQVTLTTEHDGGCTDTSYQWITSNGGFSVVAIQDSVFCQTTGHLGGEVYGGSGQYTYQWSPATGLSDPTVLVPQVSSVHEEMYTLTVTDLQTGCTAQDSTLISVYMAVNDTFSLCNGPALLDMGPGGDFYNWIPLYNDDYSTQAIWTDDTGSFYVYAVYPGCGLINHTYNIEECAGGCTITLNQNQVWCRLMTFVAETGDAPIDSVFWDFGDGTTLMSGPNASHYYDVAGTYTAHLIAYHADGCVSELTEQVVLDQMGSNLWVDIGMEDTMACNGSLSLAFTGDFNLTDTISWSPAGLMSDPDGLTTMVSVTQPTEVVLTVTEYALWGCAVADTIMVYPNLPVNQEIELCNGYVSLSLDPGSQVYSWTYEDSLGNTTPLTAFNEMNEIIVDEVGTYTCMTYTSGCNQVIHEFEVVECASSCTSSFVYSLDAPVCAGWAEFIANVSSTTDSITFHFGDGTSFTTTGISAQHYMMPGVYTVEMIAYHSDGCISEYSEIITVGGGLTAQITPDSVACGGNNYNLGVNVTGGSGTYAYQWFSSTASLSDPTVQNPIVYGITEATEIAVYVTDAVSGCQVADTTWMFPNNPINETVELCQGSLLLDVPAGSDMYDWTYEDTLGNVEFMTEYDGENVATAYAVGTYTCITYTSGCDQVIHEYIVTDCYGGCASFVTFNIMTSGCGAQVDMIPSFTPNIDSLFYDFGDGTTFSTTSGGIIQHFYPNGIYVVNMVAFHDNGCVSEDIQTLVVDEGINADIMNDSLACGGDVLLMSSVSGGTGGYMYQWFVNGLPFSGSTTQSPIIDPITSATEITLFVTDSSNNCTASDTAVIYPNVAINETVEMCWGVAVLEVPPYSQYYNWTYTDSLGNTSNLTSEDHFISVDDLGTYVCTSYTSGCLQVFHEFEVVECGGSCYTEIMADVDYDGCGAWVELSVTQSLIMDSVVWDLGNGQEVVNDGTGQLFYYGSGSYLISAEAHFSDGCVYSTTFGLTLLTEVVAEIWEDTIACNGTLPLGVDVTGGSAQYEFEWHPVSMMDDPTDQYPIMTVSESAMVTVTVVDTYTGCTVQDSVMVYANAPLNEVYELCQDSVTLAVDPGSMVYQWTYTDLGGTTTQLSDMDHEVTVAGLGTYACFTYYSGCGTITHLFTVVECAGSNDDVWPGDANSDNIVTNADALWLGLGFGQTGPVRPNASLNWVGQPADDWAFNFAYNNVNLKHADCDGNGIINFDDTLAIDQNYGLTHNKVEMELTGGEPELWIDAAPDTTGLEQGVHISVYMAKADLLVDSIHGLAFSLVWDESLTMPGEVQLNYDQSIFGTPGVDQLTFNKKIPNEGRMDIAMTRIDGENIDGHGLLCELRIVTIDNLSGIAYLDIGIEGLTALTSSEDSVGFILGSDVVVIDPEKTGIGEIPSDRPIQVYPNPSNGTVYVLNEGMQANLEVMDSRGRVVHSTSIPAESRVEVDLSGYETGVYHLRMTTSDAVRYAKLKLVR